jgi:hypothetical protein
MFKQTQVQVQTHSERVHRGSGICRTITRTVGLVHDNIRTITPTKVQFGPVRVRTEVRNRTLPTLITSVVVHIVPACIVLYP